LLKTCELVGLYNSRRTQRQQTDQRSNFQALTLAVREAQNVAEEAVLLVQQLIFVVSHVIHRRRDPNKVFEELDHHVLVRRIVNRQLKRDLKHCLREESHPRCAISLLEIAAGRKRRAAIEDTDVVEAEKSTFKNVTPIAVLAIYPPRKIE